MTDDAKGPLRRRMIEDMTIRKFAPKTQHDRAIEAMGAVRAAWTKLDDSK